MAGYRYMQCNCFCFGKLCFLVYMYYMHPSYRTSIVGKNCVYYIHIFTVLLLLFCFEVFVYWNQFTVQ